LKERKREAIFGCFGKFLTKKLEDMSVILTPAFEGNV